RPAGPAPGPRALGVAGRSLAAPPGRPPLPPRPARGRPEGLRGPADQRPTDPVAALPARRARRGGRAPGGGARLSSGALTARRPSTVPVRRCMRPVLEVSLLPSLLSL